MGYESYRGWLKGLTDKELDEEIKKVSAAAQAATDVRSKLAWTRMLGMAHLELKRTNR